MLRPWMRCTPVLLAGDLKESQLLSARPTGQFRTGPAHLGRKVTASHYAEWIPAATTYPGRNAMIGVTATRGGPAL